ncbi:cellobiose phosphorylase [Mycoplasmatota bacterium WC30]
MKDYYFNEDQFVIDNYLEKSTFSNFLPGLAGKRGIPLWAFYVNRGQGISGYGIQDKNHPIMEFTPANKAYESVGQIGFRTFIKVDGVYYEPFLPDSGNLHRMRIERTSFSIEEINENLGIKIVIKYFGLPNENIGALARKVVISNLTDKALNIEVLDGIAEILPAGVQNQEFKAISNLLSSWMDVDDLESNYAFYKLRSSTGDHSEVTKIVSGNYLFGIVDNHLVKPIVDQEIVFGFDSLKRTASNFINKGYENLINSDQVTVNKLPCGFIPAKKVLNPNESLKIDILSGFTHNKIILNQFIQKALANDFLTKKDLEAKKVIDDIVNDVATDTGSSIFNEYIKQSYLDNTLRGGYPEKIGNTIYHLFSRRHGDLERDYNFFSLTPEFYSQGGGNFRDVCQNRRMDSFIHKEVEAHNINHFASLIQLDGYNPLIINGMTYEINDGNLRKDLVNKHFSSNQKEVYDFLSEKFTPGGLVNFIENKKIDVRTDKKLCLDDVIANSTENIESTFGEGYWADHFTYIIDLVESYEAIYPDKIKDVLFKENNVLTFETPVTVLSKANKSVINSVGKIRQYGSLLHQDEDKITRLNLNRQGSNWVKLNNQNYLTNVFTKLFILILNKHSLLDNFGIGIEMESDKPGWNDAMNGVPGLFGSGIGETVELERVVKFLLNKLDNEDLVLPGEVFDLFNSLSNARDYEDRLKAREYYRQEIRFGLSGSENRVNYLDIKNYLQRLDDYLMDTLNKLYEENEKIIPTFVVYNVEDYKKVMTNGDQAIGNYGMPLVEPTKYSKRYLPKFLEAPARLLKVDFGKEKLRGMYQAIKESGIYDNKLNIYKTSGDLDAEDYEIGRIRAFTKGWLERESDFLHMIYKYLLGLLKAGLYEEFYEEIKTNLVCFMDPEVYGRNPLENSSFIAPSNNPNPNIHGKGFLPRLSGSTVEVLEIWAIMMTGGNPFKLKAGKLIFKPEPKLSKEFFKKDKTLSFSFMKNIKVTYINEDSLNTYGDYSIAKIELKSKESNEIYYQDFVDENQALKIREGFYKEIKIYIKNS